MRKVGVRRVWDAINSKFGQYINAGHKKDVFNYMRCEIEAFNDGEYKNPIDLCGALQWAIPCYFRQYGTYVCGEITQMCFDLAK